MNALKDVLQHVSLHLENIVLLFSHYIVFFDKRSLFKGIAPAKNHYDYETCYVIHCSFPKIGYVFMAFLIRIFLLIVIS